MSDFQSPSGVEVPPELQSLQERGKVIQNEEDENRIMNYLQEEILDVLEGDVRSGLMDKVQKWRRQREAVPESESKNFPWEGASNVEVPLAMMTTNSIHALLRNSFNERDPFWMVETSTKDLVTKQESEAISVYLDALCDSPAHVNLRPKISEMLYELVSLGTQFVKIPWIIDRWRTKSAGASGVTEETDKIVRNCPGVIPIKFENFITQPYWDNLQRAPWCGQIIYLMEHELKQRAANGIYENVENVLAFGTSDMPKEREEILDRMGIALGTSDKSKMYAIMEIYLYEDIDGDGYPEDIVVWIHPETGTFLRSELNDLGMRPYVRIPYFNRPGELYGIGVGWIVERLQDEVSALHNMRIDGTMLSMLQMYVTSEDAQLGNEEDWRPLKHITVPDASRDFQAIKFPDISPGTIQAEYVTKEYADRATGATDAMMGFESFAGSSRRTASGTQFLAQQNMRTLQPIVDSIESALGEVGQIMTYQLVRNSDLLGDTFGLVGPEYHGPLKRVLERDLSEIPANFIFRVKTTSAEQTEDAKRQSKLTLVQLYVQYGQQIFSMLPMIYGQQQSVPPEIKAVAAKFFVGATQMMDEIFKFFGEERSDKYLPYVRDIGMMLEAMDMQKDLNVSAQRGAQNGQNTGSIPQAQNTSAPPPSYGGSDTLGGMATGEGTAVGAGGEI